VAAAGPTVTRPAADATSAARRDVVEHRAATGGRDHPGGASPAGISIADSVDSRKLPFHGGRAQAARRRGQRGPCRRRVDRWPRRRNASEVIGALAQRGTWTTWPAIRYNRSSRKLAAQRGSARVLVGRAHEPDVRHGRCRRRPPLVLAAVAERGRNGWTSDGSSRSRRGTACAVAGLDRADDRRIRGNAPCWRRKSSARSRVVDHSSSSFGR